MDKPSIFPRTIPSKLWIFPTIYVSLRKLGWGLNPCSCLRLEVSAPGFATLVSSLGRCLCQRRHTSTTQWWWMDVRDPKGDKKRGKDGKGGGGLWEITAVQFLAAMNMFLLLFWMKSILDWIFSRQNYEEMIRKWCKLTNNFCEHQHGLNNQLVISWLFFVATCCNITLKEGQINMSNGSMSKLWSKKTSGFWQPEGFVPWRIGNLRNI